MGGKTKLAQKIISMMPPHRTYDEPFFGGGSVFWRKPPAERSVINDSDKNLMAFYRSLKEGGAERCDLTPSKERYDRVVKHIKALESVKPCDFLYANKLSFGGKTIAGYAPSKEARCSGDHAKRCGVETKDDAAYAEKLKHARIMSGDFKAAMQESDSSETLHYLDPPYYKDNQNGYVAGKDLTPAMVREAADSVRGAVMISYNVHPAVREAFCGKDSPYRCRVVHTSYTTNSKAGHVKNKPEFLITRPPK